ncbi:MaoC family dehydratase N-terminal domain-containing protein [Prescottella soli]|uniref:MaoC family dehydratase N-terminal domain-containing protein n=1 Tax=Prescottella soli TaxID=1543852 RepID=A0ABW9FSN0_9NOCA
MTANRTVDMRIVPDVLPASTPPRWPHPGLVLRSDDTYIVGREKIREFARVILAIDPAHHDVDAAQKAGYADIVAPPTFTAVVTATLIRDMLTTPGAGIDMGTHTPIHVNEKITVAAPILAGDVLTASMTITSVTERGDAVFLDTETRLRTAAGESRSTVVSSILVAPNAESARPEPESVGAR